MLMTPFLSHLYVLYNVMMLNEHGGAMVMSRLASCLF